MPDRSALPSPSSLSRAVTYLATTRTEETKPTRCADGWQQACGCLTAKRNGDCINRPCPIHQAEIAAACNEWEWGYEGHGYWGAQP